ncbi:MAG: hypothetical protein AAF740_15245, partial [Bacteroidota bacterium]
KINEALHTLQELLPKYLISLPDEERPAIPRLTPKMRQFIEASIKNLEDHPSYCPPYLDRDELQVDWKAVQQLEALYDPMKELLQMLDDSVALSGSEAYFSARAFYNYVRHAARTNTMSARAVFEELDKHYPGKHLK